MSWRRKGGGEKEDGDDFPGGGLRRVIPFKVKYATGIERESKAAEAIYDISPSSKFRN